MENSAQLAQRFREVILNGTWIANTNYKDQLTNLDWKTATTSISSLNSVALLAQHIHYFVAGIKAAFQNGTLEIRDQYSFDFAPIESQQQWNYFVEKFWQDAEEFAFIVEKMDKVQLERAFIDEKYGNFLRNIDAMIEHSYYHLGQIVLIKKLIQQSI